MPTLRQESFAGGEFSPALWSKTRFQKYGAGARSLLNFVVGPDGSAYNRSGTRMVGQTKADAVGRLFPFVFSDDDTLLLEFGNLYVRFYRYDPLTGLTGQVESAPGVPLELVTPYAIADVPRLRYAQVGDEIRLRHASYAPRVLRRLSATSWELVLSTSKRPLSLPVAAPFYTVFNQSGDSTHILKKWAWVVTAVDAEGNESGPSQPIYPGATTDADVSRKVVIYSDKPQKITFGGVSGAVSYNVYRGRNGLFGYVGSTRDVTTTEGDEGVIATFEDDGQQPDYTKRPPRDIEAFEVGQWVANTRVEAGDVVQAGSNVYVCLDGGVTGNTAPTSTGASVVDGATLDWAVDTDYSVGDLRRNLGETWRCSVAGHSAATGVGPQVVGIRSNLDGTARWVWVGTGNAARWKYLGPAPAAKRWPSVVTFYEGRAVEAGSAYEPESIFFSRVDRYDDFFTYAGSAADAPLKVSLASKRAEAVRWMLEGAALLVGTGSGEWAITGSGDKEVITPSSVAPHQLTKHGSSWVEPVLVGDDVLFVTRTGRPQLLQAAQGGYQGFDPTIVSRHLLRGRDVVRVAYAEEPWSVVWVVLSDGTLLAFTYVRAQDIWAWAPQDLSGGYVEDVCSVPEGDEDAVYLVVRRTVGGVTRRFIERLESRQIDEDDPGTWRFLDCSLVYDGAPASHFAGLDHLEGCTVTALADGWVVGGLEVSSGAVDLPADFGTASKVIVGLPHRSDFESLDAPPGEGKTRVKAVGSVAIEVAASRAGYVGQAFKDDATKGLEEVAVLDLGDDLETPVLRDEVIRVVVSNEWNKGGRCVFRQIDPLPVTILAVAREVEYGNP